MLILTVLFSNNPFCFPTKTRKASYQNKPTEKFALHDSFISFYFGRPSLLVLKIKKQKYMMSCCQEFRPHQFP